MLRAGLETAAWITVDDTGARHRGVNGVCTQIGNDNFAWFGTTGSKSRLIPGSSPGICSTCCALVTPTM